VHDGLRATLGLAPGEGGALTAAQRGGLRELYRGLAAQYPRSAAVARIPLDFTVRARGHPAAEPLAWPFAAARGRPRGRRLA
jgi:hypothetical protein